MSTQDIKRLSREIRDKHDEFVTWLQKSNIGSVEEFTRDYRFNKYKEDALFLRNLRNLASHNSLTYVDVLDSAMQRINNFVENITSSIECIMIPFNRLYTAKMSDKVLPALSVLKEKNYSYLPIVNKLGQCEEVFSSYILISYLSSRNSIDVNTTFQDIYDVINNIPCYETIEYLPRESSIVTVINTFKPTADFHLDVVLVTEHGTADEKLLGMITVWDLQ